MGIAAADGRLLVTNSRGEPSAAYRRTRRGAGSPTTRPNVDPGLGSGFAGWGASWVDLAELRAAAISCSPPARSRSRASRRTPRRCACSRRTVAARSGTTPAERSPASLKLNGRGLAAADAWNDGRDGDRDQHDRRQARPAPADRARGPLARRALTRFSPGAVVTVVLPERPAARREVQAGSSYLSSEDPRVHFGLGSRDAGRAADRALPVGGESRRLANVRADRVVDVLAPQRSQPPQPARCRRRRLASCTPVSDAVGRSRGSGTTRPSRRSARAQRRRRCRRATSTTSRCGRAARTTLAAARRRDARRGDQLRRLPAPALAGLVRRESRADVRAARRGSCASLCYSPDFTSTAGDSPAALGNRIAAAAIAAGRHDGSIEALHYADPSYAPQNQPLIVAQAGSTVHDATFWQPLALAQVSPRRGGRRSRRDVQTFVGSQWGHVRARFAGKDLRAARRALGDPSGAAYRQAARRGDPRDGERAAGARVDASPARVERGRSTRLPQRRPRARTSTSTSLSTAR